MTAETFKLSSPLKTHDGEVTELKLKTPRAGLLLKYGDPFKIQWNKDSDSLEYAFDNKAMTQFLAEMTGVDDLLLEDMSVLDFWNLRHDAARIIVSKVPDKDPS